MPYDTERSGYLGIDGYGYLDLPFRMRVCVCAGERVRERVCVCVGCAFIYTHLYP
jgi:hypothetical protein